MFALRNLQRGQAGHVFEVGESGIGDLAATQVEQAKFFGTWPDARGRDR